jgi:hypothetical protein
MTPTPETLGPLLSMSALIGGTIEYAELIKRRATRRREASERKESGDIGLQGLVRVLLTDGETTRVGSASATRPTSAAYRPE